MRLAEPKTRLRILLGAVALLLLAAALYPYARDEWRHHRLVAALDSSNPRQRMRAAIMLGERGDARAVPALVDTLDMSVDARSREAVAALCKLGGIAAARALEAALHRPGTDRALAIEALACIDLPEARAALAGALNGADMALLQTAVVMLSGSPDPRIVALIAGAARKTDRARRLTIVASLSDAAGRPLAAGLVAILAAAANDPDEAIRGAAREALRWNQLNQPGSTGTWKPADPSAPDGKALAAAATRAAAFLLARQDPAGFWRTARSRAPAAGGAVSEVNTYLTPMIVDMLDPVAAQSELSETLARARRQIGGEIEPSGLVRYYGAAAMAGGTNRICGIAYDADDTALAWRIAPRSDPRMLAAALKTLRDYRAPNGLYRTWLSSSDGAECIDRGKDPNPTDIAIQTHILMFLAKTSPAEGQALCAALTRAVDDDRIWVYYQREPLVPLIRQRDLAEAGCPLQIPEARIRTGVAGQGKWLAAGRALLNPHTSPADRAATLRLLHRLAQGDFAAIRQAPPLLYQNDSTAKVPAFYWSQEYGYALWLRLYYEATRGQ